MKLLPSYQYMFEACIKIQQLTCICLKHVYLVIRADMLDLPVNPRSSVPFNYERGVLISHVRTLDLASDEAVVRTFAVQLQPVAEERNSYCLVYFQVFFYY